MYKLLLVFIYIFIIFLLSTIIKKINPDNKETVRKIIHIGIGPLIPLAIYLDIEKDFALYFTGIISFLVFLNYQYRLFPAIEDVERKSFGTLFYCLSLFILISLFWTKDPTALIAGFLVMTFGDGFAGLIGRRFKSKSWFFFNQKKSLYGTMTMFLTSFIVIFSLGFSQDYNFFINFFFIATIATLLEQFSIFGIDNFFVPIAAGICFSLLITGS